VLVILQIAVYGGVQAVAQGKNKIKKHYRYCILNTLVIYLHAKRDAFQIVVECISFCIYDSVRF
jgi:hypothetical protein